MSEETDIRLTSRNQDAYEKRGNYHYLEYYDGPLLSAQMCVASDSTKMLEVAVDGRMAETDGHTVYFRASKQDLERMLRIIDEESVSAPHGCADSPGSPLVGTCLSCYPPRFEERDE